MAHKRVAWERETPILPRDSIHCGQPTKSRGGRGLFIFSSTALPLMSQIYSFLGELISIHWVQLARRKEGGQRERDLKKESKKQEPVGEQILPRPAALRVGVQSGAEWLFYNWDPR